MITQTYRLFISSTFDDFRREREVLQTQVFPEIKEYCSAKGITFQPIDLRWGVNQEAQLDQKTLELCLNEVRACKTHPHPNFLVMLGDRYGWVPLPYAIEKHEFESLLDQMSGDDSQFILEWYKEDLNQIPVSYLLKERREEFIKPKSWQAVEDKLRAILQGASKILSEEEKRKYYLSATEAEVEEGIIPYIKPTDFQQKLLKKNPDLHEIDPKYIFGFLRSIDNESSRFIGDDYKEAQAFKQRVQTQLLDKNIYSVQATQIESGKLDETYLTDFSECVTQFLKLQIDNHAIQHEELTPLETEIEAQRYFAEQKRQHFMGREKILKDIADYINGDTNKPLVVHGKSGMGKSSLMAMAIKNAEEETNNQVIYQFIGATPESASMRQFLISIFDQLGVELRTDKEKQNQHGLEKNDDQRYQLLDDKTESFEDFSYRVHDAFKKITNLVILFIDAVDQLSNDDQFLWLPQILPTNIKVILSALDDEHYNKDSKYFGTLKYKKPQLLEIPPFEEPQALLKSWLNEDSRTLQDHQIKYFLQQYQKVKSPLFVAVAAQEMKYWKSFDGVPDYPEKPDGIMQDLADSQTSIIKEYITNLSDFYHHDKHFVERVLGFLYASRDGLSEHELLELLSIDDEFIQQIAPDTYHKNTNKELPLVVWVRLYTQLKPFLSCHQQDGEELLYLFHREFEEVIAQNSSQQTFHEQAIKQTLQIVEQVQNQSFDDNRWGKLLLTFLTELDLFFQKKSRKYFKKYVQKIPQITNKEWLDSFLGFTSSIGLELDLYNHSKVAISHHKLSYLVSKHTYEDNPSRRARDYIRAQNNLASSYMTSNYLIEAIELLKKSLGIVEVLYLDNPIRWAKDYTKTVNNLASSYSASNQLVKAIELEEKNLDILKTLYIKDPFHWAEAYTTAQNNLATSYRASNRLVEAIELQEKSLEIRETLYADNPPLWAEAYTKALNNLAISYSSCKRLIEAIELEEKSLGIVEVLYSDSPSLWVEAYTKALNNLALSYNSSKRLAEAIELQEKSLGVLEVFYQEDPSRWAEYYTIALKNLAAYYNNNRYDDAIALEEKNLAIHEVLFQGNPSRWVEGYTKALNNLAITYYTSNRRDDAMMLQQKSLPLLESLYQTNPIRWANTYIGLLKSLAVSYYRNNRHEDAMVLEEKSLIPHEILYQTDPLNWVEDFTRSLNTLSDIYFNNGLLSKSLELLHKQREVFLELYGKNSEQLKEVETSINNLSEKIKK